jgi:hypothetical protein
MQNHLYGKFDDEIVLQGFHPRIADVGSGDYNSEFFKGKRGEVKQFPFLFSHPRSICAKVEFWDGSVSLWTFEPGKDPVLVKKIFASPTPLIVENGIPTSEPITEIQIIY